MTEAIFGPSSAQKRAMQLQETAVTEQRDTAMRQEGESQMQAALQPRNRGGRRLLQYLEGSGTLGG